MPLVGALAAEVAESGRGFVHWGATSQDVIDTATMLVARDGLSAMREDLRASAAALRELIGAHRDSLMPGRTLLQQALPISFAFKSAGWLSALTASAARLRRVQATSLAVQFGGAAGTLAALGGDGLEVRAALARRLDLPEPTFTWHADRGRIAEIAFGLAGLSGTCAKIATDVLLLMQSEIGEVFEPPAPGRGGSSTMPHKRNPVGAAAIRANHRRVAGLTATMSMALECEHERAPGAWASEWETLRDLFCLTAGSLERLRDMLGGLEVDPLRMRVNLDATLGLPLAESLMITLAAGMGRMQAHQVVERAAKRAAAQRASLLDVALADPAISGVLSSDAIARALDPEAYLGAADAMIDAALASAEHEMETP